MSQDELLERLAQVARERRTRETDDPRWERLAAGALSEQERAELERLASQSPEDARKREAFTPLDAAARQRIVDRIGPLLATAPPAGKVVPFRPRRWVAVVPALAAAAAVLFFAWPGRQLAPVPEYQLALSGEQALRGEPSAEAVPRLGPGSQLSLVLRPARAVEGAIQVRAFLVQGGKAQPWNPPMEVSSEGAVRIAGLVETLLPVAPGEWTIAVAVGRAGAVPELPSEVEAMLAGGQPGREGVRLLTARFQRIDR